MKKTKKAIASLAIAGMALTMIPFNVLATGTVPNRLSGVTAEQTAVQIADQTGWTGKAILASSASYGMVDALTAGPLASYLHAPILLTGAGNVLDASTKAELVKLAVTKVYVTSGTAVISQGVLDELAAMNITVVKLGGVDRAATSVNIANQMVGVTKVAIANSVQDALSIAAIASAANQPILLTDKDVLPPSVAAYLAANLGITSSDVIGGTGIISEAVKTAVPNATRHAGNSAYDTNNQVIQDLASSLLFDQVYMANGATGIDALAGAPLAAQTKSAIVLTDGVNTPAAAAFVSSKVTATSVVTALGGAAVVPETHRSLVVSTTLAVSSVSAINATQLSVVFNKAVDPVSVFTDGIKGGFLAGTTVTATSLDGNLSGAVTGTLSADGLTLTITAANPLSKRYDVVIDGFKAKTGEAMTKYLQMITIVKDTAAPTMVSVTQTSAFVFRVTFSEPIKSLGTISYTSPSGLVGGVASSIASNVATFDLSGSTINGAAAVPGQVVTATFVGAQDEAMNLLTPNPATATFTIGAKDGVKPTVTSFTQTGAKTLNIKFSEALLAAPTVIVANTAPLTVVKDTTDPTIYKVEMATLLLDGPMVVGVSAFSDASGEVGANMTQVVTFVKDIVAPSVVSSVVSVDPIDRKEYLEMTFDKDVTLAAPTITAGAGSNHTKDYITTSITTGQITVAYKTATNKKVVRVALATLLAGNDVKDASYTLKLAIAGITNGASIPANTPVTATFVRGLDGVAANTNLLTVTSVLQQVADNNKVDVTFDKAVDGASAVNVANYSIAGAVVSSVTLLPVSGGTQTAVLNLQAGSNLFTGVRNINISNVKALGSTVVMTPYSTSAVSLKENVAPTIVAAKLTDLNQVTLTFSENVKSVGSLGDFELYIGGAKIAANDQVTTNTTGLVATKTVVLTLEIPVTAANISAGLTLKPVTVTILDEAGNRPSIPTTGFAVTQ